MFASRQSFMEESNTVKLFEEAKKEFYSVNPEILEMWRTDERAFYKHLRRFSKCIMMLREFEEKYGSGNLELLPAVEDGFYFRTKEELMATYDNISVLYFPEELWHHEPTEADNFFKKATHLISRIFHLMYGHERTYA